MAHIAQSTWHMGAETNATKYGYDLDSRRTWREVPLAGATQQGQAFSYDDLSQLRVRGLGELDAGAITAPDRKETFTYDETGNWSNYLRQKKVGGSLIDELDQYRTHNAGNQITQFDGSSTMVEYDGNGNATKTPPLLAAWGEAMDLTWDAWNRLVKVENDSATVAEYAYDALWRRTMKTADGQTTHYFYNDQWRPLEERPGSATAPAEFAYLWGSRHRDDLVRRDGSPGGSSGSGSGFGSIDYFEKVAPVPAAPEPGSSSRNDPDSRLHSLASRLWLAVDKGQASSECHQGQNHNSTIQARAPISICIEFVI